MSWLTLSIISAVFVTFRDLIGKHNLNHINAHLVSLALWLFALPAVIPALYWSAPISLSWSWGLPLLLSTGLNTIQTYLTIYAIKRAPLSQAAPLIAFVPAFTLLSDPFLSGQYPSVLGLLGITLILAGSYFLNFEALKGGVFEPFKALLKNKALLAMLIAALVRATCSSLDRAGVLRSNPLFFTVALIASTSISLAICSHRQLIKARFTRPQFLRLLAMGLFNGISILTAIMAFQTAIAAYVTSIRQLNLLVTVLVAGWLFRESNIKSRFFAALLMLVGAVVIALYGK